MHRIILRNFGGRIMNSLIVHVRQLSVENEALCEINEFYLSLKTWVKDHGDSFSWPM